MADRRESRDGNEFRRRYGPWALVAGASEGIGQAFCRQLAARGLNIVMLARRREPLAASAEEIRTQHGVEVRSLELDLAAPDAVAVVRRETSDLEIGFLAYNAAFAPIGDFMSLSEADKLKTLDVNCRGVVLLTTHLAEPMLERGRGGIVLMSSMSGWQGSALVGIYAASKAFITVLGESLWEEFRPHGVDAHVCVAGATLTPSFESQTPTEKQGSAFPLPPERVVAEALANMGGRPSRVVGRVNRIAHVALGKLAPRRVAIRLMSRATRSLYGSPNASKAPR